MRKILAVVHLVLALGGCAAVAVPPDINAIEEAHPEHCWMDSGSNLNDPPPLPGSYGGPYGLMNACHRYAI